MSKYALVSLRKTEFICSIADGNSNPKIYNFENIDNVLNMFTEIPDLMVSTFLLFDFDDFAFGYNLRLKCREFCAKNKIKNVFLHEEILHASAVLLAAEIECSVGNSICLIIVYDTFIRVYHLIQHHLYCMLKNLDDSVDVDDKEAFQNLAIKFVSDKIIISYHGSGKTMKKTKKCYEKIKTYFNDIIEENNFQHVDIDVKKFMHQSNVINSKNSLAIMPHKFAIMPIAFSTIGIISASKIGTSNDIVKDSILIIYQEDSLPYSHTANSEITDDLIVFKFIAPNDYCILKRIDTTEFRTFSADLCLKLDESCFHHLTITNKQKPSFNNSFSRMHTFFPLQTCKPLIKPENIPFIYFENNIFEIGLTNGFKYCILEGYENVPLSFGIEETRYLFGMTAFNHRDQTAVIHDLLKIMSSPVENLRNNPNWNFELVTDKNDEIYVVFKTNDGGKMQISLILCIAAIIKLALKTIETKTGVIASDYIEIGLPDFNDRTKTTIQSACKMLNLQVQLYDDFCYREMERVEFKHFYSTTNEKIINSKTLPNSKQLSTQSSLTKPDCEEAKNTETMENEKLKKRHHNKRTFYNKNFQKINKFRVPNN